GFPLAKIAALLAVGYALDEISNDIPGETPASFEPSLDYVVVKLPRWAFEKFPGVNPILGPQMKSVGEAMAIGRTFKEALNKGLRSLEIGDWRTVVRGAWNVDDVKRPTRERLFQVLSCLHRGVAVEEIVEATGYDPWFVDQLAQIVELEQEIARHTLDTLPAELLRQAIRYGLADETIAELLSPLDGGDESGGTPTSHALPITSDVPRTTHYALRPTSHAIRAKRLALGLRPVYQRVDTCAAEFEAFTPYLYSTYESQDEAKPTGQRKVMILGGGPNRIGQGIEFDYCCVHACFALREAGFETIMVNCNPETVSTDYDTADRLYFEPLTLEDVLNIVELEQPEGVIVQFGGQTPLNLAEGLAAAGVPIWGTSPASIAMAEDREQFEKLLNQLGIDRPRNGIATNLAEAQTVARAIGYPVLVRPSFVLGGRAMAIVYDEARLASYIEGAIEAAPGRPLLLDQYLEDAFEVDVDAVSDGERVIIGGVLQHIEEAGIHSGDSACVLPPYKISAYHLSIITDYTEQLGQALNVCGLLNVQYAIKDDVVYVLEVNPRASRTVPFVSKATNVPLAKIAARVMAGETLAQIGFTRQPEVKGFFVKEAVLPFRKFAGVDAALGPEMRSTGEVMGHAHRFGAAFAKAQLAAGDRLPRPGDGKVFITVNDFDKSAALKIGRDLAALGFELVATPGTAAMLSRVGVRVQAVNRYSEGDTQIVEMMKTGQIALIINTPLGGTAYSDGQLLRTEATRLGIPLVTTLTAAQAAVNGIKVLAQESLQVRSLQKLHD
ncbi:MAG TPA: carbamoyl-phosphate synthase large subunit, partial [Anaerolineae bacterium]|nr:carbamoyl-phosphate synthase large subunit [Anaerolineae bacterium]